MEYYVKKWSKSLKNDLISSDKTVIKTCACRKTKPYRLTQRHFRKNDNYLVNLFLLHNHKTPYFIAITHLFLRKGCHFQADYQDNNNNKNYPILKVMPEN